MLKYSNADDSAIVPTSVTALIDGTEETLVKDTDYSVGVDLFGSTYIKLISGSKLDANSPT